METLKYVVLAFLIFAIMGTGTPSASVAEAKNPTGILHVNETLYCSPNGASSSRTSAPVFRHAEVQVACTKDAIANAPANATTNSNGVYLVVLIPRPTATISTILSACRLYVLTPLDSCSTSLPSAGLVSTMKYVETVLVSKRYITYLTASGFTTRV